MRDGRAVVAEIEFKCHRAAADKAPLGPAYRAPKRSKKTAGCTFFLRCTVYADAPNVVEATEHGGHRGHEPGSAEDRRWLPLPADVQSALEALLGAGLSPVVPLLALQAPKAGTTLDKEGVARAIMVTLTQVHDLQAVRAARTRLDPNDAVSVAKAIAQLGEGGAVAVEQHARFGDSQLQAALLLQGEAA